MVCVLLNLHVRVINGCYTMYYASMSSLILSCTFNVFDS